MTNHEISLVDPAPITVEPSMFLNLHIA